MELQLGDSGFCRPHRLKWTQTKCVHDLCTPCGISCIFVLMLSPQYIGTRQITVILIAGKPRIPHVSIDNLLSTAPSPIDPVLTVQPDHCYIFFSLKNTFKNYFINYHNIIHLSLVRRTRQTLKTKPLIMLSIDWQIWENTLTQQP